MTLLNILREFGNAFLEKVLAVSWLVGMYAQCLRLVFESGTGRKRNASGVITGIFVESTNLMSRCWSKVRNSIKKHFVEEYARHEFDEAAVRDGIRKNIRQGAAARLGIKMITPQPRGVISCNELFGSFYASL